MCISFVLFFFNLIVYHMVYVILTSNFSLYDLHFALIFVLLILID